MESYKDWSRNIYFLCSDTNPSVEACGVPFSCCLHQQNQVRNQEQHLQPPRSHLSGGSQPSPTWRSWTPGGLHSPASTTWSNTASAPPVLLTCVAHLQTVLNTMCGYGVQPLDKGAAARLISTVGCLEKIVRWARTNLLLVGGLTLGLLLLEVTH